VAIRISLVLIDDDPSACEGVVALIRAEPGFHVLAASATIEEALRQVRQTRPDLVLLKLEHMGNDSLKVAGALHGESPESRVIVMGMKPFHEDVEGFVGAGVSGFTMADASSDTFLATIRSVAGGNRVLPSELTGSLFGQLNGLGVPGHPEKRLRDRKALTRRERAVTALIVQGLSNKAIAARLLIALHTVKSHVHKVLSKLAVNSRLEVAAFSRRSSDATP